MALRLVAASQTDVGKQREQNEDACSTEIVEDDNQAYGLFIVADGMGGYHAGEVASQIAIETISTALRPLLGPTSGQPTMHLNRKRGHGDPHSDLPDAAAPGAAAESAAEATTPQGGAPTQELGETVAFEHYTRQLRDAVQRGSKAIVEYGAEHSEARGLGSTVTVALVIEEQAFIANVGDSRTYLLRDGKLQRLTHDHSLVERLVEAGQIEREDVYDHPSRNLIYRSLGAGRADVDVDIFIERLQPGDALLLCCDGLWEMVRDAQLESILAEVSDPGEACNLLIERANEHGGEDNITAVLVRCLEG